MGKGPAKTTRTGRKLHM